MQLVINQRRSALYAAIIGLAVSLLGTRWSPLCYWGVAIFGALVLLGLYDITQRRRTLSRNYPILIHFRYFLESIGPEMRQYFIEADTDDRPFSREQRHLVYQRAKQTLDKRPFGTMLDVYGEGYEWINHSMAPRHIASHDFRVTVGAERTQPYAASVFNISAMSFGALSAHAILALNAGARRGGFYHDTGEGSISRHHREHGGDLVWEIGSGYFGCRNEAGSFSESRFAENARDAQVKMIELKLSQGAKPGHGGVLPGAKVTPEIAEARGVPAWQTVESPAAHSVFSTPIELLQFIARLRELSGDKPTGFKLAIGHPWEWFAIVKAMHETGIVPDFIVVDGKEGGTGAAPVEFINRVGMPLREGLLLVHTTLVGMGLRERIRIGAAGKITSAFNVARTLAIGADWCNAARAFMFALGCIQSRSCHNDQCPTGIATQDPHRWRHLDVPDKAERVFHYHQATLIALKELVAAAGLDHPSQLLPDHILRRISQAEVVSYARLYPQLRPGELLERIPEHVVFQRYWEMARPDRFGLAADVGEWRQAHG
ncbi:MAG: FMN-binding glutamate synthase family protein [Xanthomonadaceae bacterium]|nr:FMN-binding glutamate synthase family protein [Xanthomonadaceae bacterium]